MSIQTVGSIRLPKLSVAKPRIGLAKQLFIKVLERASHGHLEIIDGDDHQHVKSGLKKFSLQKKNMRKASSY